jgi:putative ABC transport system permease protein
MALGATTGDVSGLVLRDALGIVCAGLAAGAALALWSRPLVASLVQDLKPDGSTALVLGGAAMVAVALLAASVPMRRATRVDPMVALRHE